MARAPQQRQQPAPALGSPLARRSQYLAQALEAMRQEPQRIGGYGDLGARLLAQALTQAAAEKTDKAVSAEQSNEALRRRRAMFPGLTIEGEEQEVGNGRLGNPFAGFLRRGQPQQPQPAPAAPMPEQSAMPPTQATAPVPPVENGGALPPVGMMPQNPVPAAPQQQAMPQAQPQQAGIPPQLEQQIMGLLSVGTPEAEQQAFELYQGWQQQQMILAQLPEVYRDDPRYAFIAGLNPEALGQSLARGFEPQTAAAGSQVITPATGQTFAVPKGEQFGTQFVEYTPGEGVRTLAERGPTPQEQAALISANRPQAVTTATGSDTRLIGPNGEVIGEFAGRETPRQANPQAAEIQSQITALDTDVFPVLQRQEALLRSGDVITGFGAEQRLAAARLAAAAGNETARRQVAATEEYQNNSGRLRVGMAKSLGANPSNADILLLERVTAGDIGQSTEGLLATIGQGRALAERQKAGFESRLGSYGAQGGASNGPEQRRLSPDEARRLPSGTEFIGLDGQRYRVP